MLDKKQNKTKNYEQTTFLKSNYLQIQLVRLSPFSYIQLLPYLILMQRN